jgi:hypothetical protein
LFKKSNEDISLKLKRLQDKKKTQLLHQASLASKPIGRASSHAHHHHSLSSHTLLSDQGSAASSQHTNVSAQHYINLIQKKAKLY